MEKIIDKYITDYTQLKNDNNFKNEKELRDYIILNKETFCREILKVEYKSHILEFKFKPIENLHDNSVFVDIVFIDTNDCAHFIELKCPKFGYNELMQGLGQCMTYYYLARAHNYNLAEVYLVTSKHNNLIPLVIRDNNLRIRYVYFDKSQHAISHTGY